MEQARNMSLAFFMPAHNEASNLDYVVAEAVKCLNGEGYDFTVIIVDDGSTDNTGDVFRDLHDRHGDAVQLVRHERNRGYGAALRTGINAGLETGHDWVAFCDSDGQFSPSQVLELLHTASLTQADIVVGYRAQRADSLKRKLMGRGWHWLSRVYLSFQAKDVDCGFKLFRREALQALPRLAGDDATISPELFYCARRLGLKVVEMGVNHAERRSGEQSGAKLRVIARSLVGLLYLRYQHRNSFPRG